MALFLDSVIKYIPEYGNERKSHEEGSNGAPLTFHIRQMGAIPFRVFAGKLAAATRDDEGSAISEEVITIYREAVCGHVVKIENLQIDGVPIVDGASFYDHPAMPHDLVMEIEKALTETNKLSEDESKNSETSQ